MIRHLKRDEVAALLPLSAQVNALHEEVHPEQYHGEAAPEEVIGFFAEKIDGGAIVFVDVGDDLVRGFLLAVPVVREKTPFTRVQRYVEMDQVCVGEEFRGLGIGRELVAAMEAWMAEEGFTEWRSMVHGFNTQSQNLMRGQGAETYGVRFRKTL